MSTSCRQEDTAHTYYTHQFVSHSVAARFQLFDSDCPSKTTPSLSHVRLGNAPELATIR
eukprot:COSAG02_NODE_6270_length_3692_cov_13.749513_1_plen_59_part_00